MLLYALTIFTSAFLLFQIQPIIGKIILPWFGGTAAVWTTCLLFFQIVLLLGYLYAHCTIQYLRSRQQVWLHVILLVLSAGLLRVVPDPAWKPQGGADPTFGILSLLLVTVGLPFFLLSTTGPLLQAWYARSATELRNSADEPSEASPNGAEPQPYRLYALSNAGSLLALLGYPILVEPYFTIRQQAVEWTTGYYLFALLCGLVAWQVHTQAQTQPLQGQPSPVAEASTVLEEPFSAVIEADSPAPKSALYLYWLLLAALPSVMLLAVTNHLTQNVAAIPFLWVLPLSLYLLSFIVCFGVKNWRWERPFLPLPALAIVGMTYGLIEGGSHPSLRMLIPLYAFGLFVCCILCHGELARLKPSPHYLTGFYLMMSIGGALGGIFVGLLAPHLFNDYYELPLSIAACAVLALFVVYRDPEARLWNSAWWVLAGLTLGLICYMVQGLRDTARNYRLTQRNFYGVLHVSEDGDPESKAGELRSLTHGTTLHGQQFLKPERHLHPTTYYGPESGVGLAVRAKQRREVTRVGVIGLGTGTIACYGRPRDFYRFYDINPLVVRLSRQEFSFIRDGKAHVTVVLGDARLSLEREPKQNFDVLAVDAFSSDSIPVHLLTREAFQLYFRHLKPDGVLAVHVSNRYLNLQPVVQTLAQSLGQQARLVRNEEDDTRHITTAEWVLVTVHPQFFQEPLLKGVAEPITSRKKIRLWTDDYSNLYTILR